MAEKIKRKLEFSPEQTSPTVQIHNGEYRRTFVASEAPFECEIAEAKMLLKSGHFIEVRESIEQSAESTTQPEAASEGGEASEPTEAAAPPVKAGRAKRAAGAASAPAKPADESVTS